MTSEFVSCIKGEVYEIAINSVANGNKLSNDIMDTVVSHLKEADQDDNCKAVIFYTEGDIFCVGASQLQDVRVNTPKEILEFGSHFIDFHAAFKRCHKPIICAIEGEAVGAGWSIIDACDLAVCAENTLVSISEILFGNCPGMGIAGIYVQLPKKVLMECGLLGRKLTSSECLEYGMVNRVVESGKVYETAREMAKEFSELSPTGIYMFKEIVRKMDMGAYENRMSVAQGLLVSMLKSPDGQEVVNAKEQNRKPQWSNK